MRQILKAQTMFTTIAQRVAESSRQRPDLPGWAHPSWGASVTGSAILWQLDLTPSTFGVAFAYTARFSGFSRFHLAMRQILKAKTMFTTITQRVAESSRQRPDRPGAGAPKLGCIPTRRCDPLAA